MQTHPMYVNRSEPFANVQLANAYAVHLVANGYSVGNTSVQPAGTKFFVVFYN